MKDLKIFTKIPLLKIIKFLDQNPKIADINKQYLRKIRIWKKN